MYVHGGGSCVDRLHFSVDLMVISFDFALFSLMLFSFDQSLIFFYMATCKRLKCLSFSHSIRVNSTVLIFVYYVSLYSDWLK